MKFLTYCLIYCLTVYTIFFLTDSVADSRISYSNLIQKISDYSESKIIFDQSTARRVRTDLITSLSTRMNEWQSLTPEEKAQIAEEKGFWYQAVQYLEQACDLETEPVQQTHLEARLEAAQLALRIHEDVLVSRYTVSKTTQKSDKASYCMVVRRYLELQRKRPEVVRQFENALRAIGKRLSMSFDNLVADPRQLNSYILDVLDDRKDAITDELAEIRSSSYEYDFSIETVIDRLRRIKFELEELLAIAEELGISTIYFKDKIKPIQVTLEIWDELRKIDVDILSGRLSEAEAALIAVERKLGVSKTGIVIRGGVKYIISSTLGKGVSEALADSCEGLRRNLKWPGRGGTVTGVIVISPQTEAVVEREVEVSPIVLLDMASRVQDVQSMILRGQGHQAIALAIDLAVVAGVIDRERLDNALISQRLNNGALFTLCGETVEGLQDKARSLIPADSQNPLYETYRTIFFTKKQNIERAHKHIIEARAKIRNFERCLTDIQARIITAKSYQDLVNYASRLRDEFWGSVNKLNNIRIVYARNMSSEFITRLMAMVKKMIDTIDKLIPGGEKQAPDEAVADDVDVVEPESIDPLDVLEAQGQNFALVQELFGWLDDSVQRLRNFGTTGETKAKGFDVRVQGLKTRYDDVRGKVIEPIVANIEVRMGSIDESLDAVEEQSQRTALIGELIELNNLVNRIRTIDEALVRGFEGKYLSLVERVKDAVFTSLINEANRLYKKDEVQGTIGHQSTVRALIADAESNLAQIKQGRLCTPEEIQEFKADLGTVDNLQKLYYLKKDVETKKNEARTLYYQDHGAQTNQHHTQVKRLVQEARTRLKQLEVAGMKGPGIGALESEVTIVDKMQAKYYSKMEIKTLIDDAERLYEEDKAGDTTTNESIVIEKIDTARQSFKELRQEYQHVDLYLRELQVSEDRLDAFNKRQQDEYEQTRLSKKATEEQKRIQLEAYKQRFGDFSSRISSLLVQETLAVTDEYRIMAMLSIMERELETIGILDPHEIYELRGQLISLNKEVRENFASARSVKEHTKKKEDKAWKSIDDKSLQAQKYAQVSNFKEGIRDAFTAVEKLLVYVRNKNWNCYNNQIVTVMERIDAYTNEKLKFKKGLILNAISLQCDFALQNAANAENSEQRLSAFRRLANALEYVIDSTSSQPLSFDKRNQLLTYIVRVTSAMVDEVQGVEDENDRRLLAQAIGIAEVRVWVADNKAYLLEIEGGEDLAERLNAIQVREIPQARVTLSSHDNWQYLIPELTFHFGWRSCSYEEDMDYLKDASEFGVWDGEGNFIGRYYSFYDVEQFFRSDNQVVEILAYETEDGEFTKTIVVLVLQPEKVPEEDMELLSNPITESEASDLMQAVRRWTSTYSLHDVAEVITENTFTKNPGQFLRDYNQILGIINSDPRTRSISISKTVVQEIADFLRGELLKIRQEGTVEAAADLETESIGQDLLSIPVAVYEYRILRQAAVQRYYALRWNVATVLIGHLGTSGVNPGEFLNDYTQMQDVLRRTAIKVDEVAPAVIQEVAQFLLNALLEIRQE